MRKIQKSIRLDQKDIDYILEYGNSNSFQKALDKLISDMRYTEELTKEISRNKELLLVTKNIKRKIKFLKCHNDRYEINIKRLLTLIGGI